MEENMSPAKQLDQTLLKFDAKRFGQAFLKLDAWCESTRGQWEEEGERIANSDVGNSQWGNFPYLPIRYAHIKN